MDLKADIRLIAVVGMFGLLLALIETEHYALAWIWSVLCFIHMLGWVVEVIQKFMLLRLTYRFKQKQAEREAD